MAIRGCVACGGRCFDRTRRNLAGPHTPIRDEHAARLRPTHSPSDVPAVGAAPPRPPGLRRQRRRLHGRSAVSPARGPVQNCHSGSPFPSFRRKPESMHAHPPREPSRAPMAQQAPLAQRGPEAPSPWSSPQPGERKSKGASWRLSPGCRSGWGRGGAAPTERKLRGWVGGSEPRGTRARPDGGAGACEVSSRPIEAAPTTTMTGESPVAC